jgi:pimeloyl-ACP methyl ester carboxylesterase
MATAGTYIEANGLRVYYEVYGEGEPLLLIHGGTATSRSWASHLPAFTEHFRVFTPIVAAMAGPTTRRTNSTTA